MTTCPHCGAPDQAQASFCTRCGKALAAAATGTPRIVGKKDLASSATGQELQLQELAKQSKKASIPLFVVGVLQFVVGGIILAAASSSSGRNLPEELQGLDRAGSAGPWSSSERSS